jgi:nicotinate-nucleotide adenylyltransferase
MILFVVAAIPPHKRAPEVPVERRLDMVELAIADEPDFHASRIEIERGGASYTAETLRELRGEYVEASFFLIVGADSAIDFSSWKNPEAVIEMSDIVVAPRPGFDSSTMEPRLRSKSHILEAPELDISSTVIRKRLREGKSVEALVPTAVEEYIRTHGLYRA